MKLGIVACDVTDDCAGKRDHPHQHRTEAHNNQSNACLANIRDYIADTSGIKNHTDRIVHRGPKVRMPQSFRRKP